jgi:uncharacterized protein
VILMEERIRKIRGVVEKELECSAHSMDHVMRVFNLCLRLAEGEDVDIDVLKAAALLHDIGRVREDQDQTGGTDHALVGSEMAGPILREAGFPGEKIRRVQECILSHRFRTGREPFSLEARILFDADKLDTLGAVGIARSYMWVGRNNARMYYKPRSLEDYIRGNLSGNANGRIQDKTKHSPQIEFETKWKRVREKLHTEKARKIFDERFAFLEEFLDRLEREIRGEL